MAIPRTPHVERLFRLLSCLLGGKPLRILELAERCQSTRRGVLRDIQLLREMDYPVAVDAANQTCVLKGQGSGSPAPMLSAQEAAFLVLAVELSPLRQTRAVAVHLNAAVEKILEPFPPQQRHEIQRLLALCEVEGGARRDRSGLGEVLMAILYALRAGRSLRIGYREADGSRTTTRMRPYRLLLSGSGWQLAGLSGAHRGVVRLEVERISQAVPVEDPGLNPLGGNPPPGHQPAACPPADS